jgi:hypothetical protein
MQKLRLLPLALLSLSVGLMSACDSTSSNSGPTITNLYLDASSLVAGGGSTGIHATVADPNNGITVTFKVVQNGTDVSSDFTISYVVPVSSATSWSAFNDGKASIAAKSSAANGNDTLVMTVTDATNSGTATQKVPVTVTGGTNGGGGTAPSTVATLDVAAQGVVGVNSFISIGNATSYSGTDTKTNFGTTDLVITYDGTVTTQTNFESTAAGVADNSLQSSYWGAGRATLIADAGSTEPATLSAAEALLGNAQTAKIVNGHYYVVKTVEGVYAILAVSNATGTGTNMTLTVTILE